MKCLFFMGLAVASAAVWERNADPLSSLKRSIARVSETANALPSRIKPLHGFRRLSNEQNVTGTCKTAMDSLYAVPCVKKMTLPSKLTDSELDMEDEETRKAVIAFVKDGCNDCLTKIDVIQAANAVKDKCSGSLDPPNMDDEGFLADGSFLLAISDVCKRDSKGKLCMVDMLEIANVMDEMCEVWDVDKTTEEEAKAATLAAKSAYSLLCENECFTHYAEDSVGLCHKFDGELCSVVVSESEFYAEINNYNLEYNAFQTCDFCTRLLYGEILVSDIAKKIPIPIGGSCDISWYHYDQYDDGGGCVGGYCSESGTCVAPTIVDIGGSRCTRYDRRVACADGSTCDYSNTCVENSQLLVQGDTCSVGRYQCYFPNGMYCNSNTTTCQPLSDYGTDCDSDLHLDANREQMCSVWCEYNDVFGAAMCGGRNWELVKDSMGVNSCVVPPTADSCSMVMAKFLASQDCTVATENKCCFAYAPIELRQKMAAKCSFDVQSLEACQNSKTFQDVTLKKVLSNVNGAYFTANKNVLYVRLYYDLALAYFPHEIDRASITAILVDGDALDISFKVRDDVSYARSHTDIEVDETQFKHAMKDTNFIFRSIVPTIGSAADQTVEINIKTTASFAQELTSDGETKVKTAYCKAASFTFGVASSQVTCTIGKASGSRRLLAGVSYAMNALVMVDEAVATTALAQMSETSASITNVFVAQSDVTAANGGVAMTADAVTVSQEVEVEAALAFSYSTPTQTASGLSVLALLVACLTSF